MGMQLQLAYCITPAFSFWGLIYRLKLSSSFERSQQTAIIRPPLTIHSDLTYTNKLHHQSLLLFFIKYMVSYPNHRLTDILSKVGSPVGRQK